MMHYASKAGLLEKLSLRNKKFQTLNFVLQIPLLLGAVWLSHQISKLFLTAS